MAKITPTTAKLELRLGEDGRLKAFYDGVRLCGVTSIDVFSPVGERAEVVLRFTSVATRLVTDAPNILDCEDVHRG